MLTTIVVATISALIPLLALRLAKRFFRRADRLRRENRPANGDEPIRIPYARAATDLMPLINHLPDHAGASFESAELWVFGSDGRYVLKDNGKRWQEQLTKWSDGGLTIKYILMDADDDVRRAFADICADAENLEVLVLKADNDLDVRLCNELDTCHPTLFMAEDGKHAAWIEGLHYRDSEYAYAVRYYSPNVLRDRRRERAEFDSYREKMERVIANCEPVAAQAAIV